MISQHLLTGSEKRIKAELTSANLELTSQFVININFFQLKLKSVLKNLVIKKTRR